MPVVRAADNLAEFARRGGAVSAGTRLLVVRCVVCRRTYLYDETRDRLYVDPEDLQRVIEDGAQADAPAECLHCASADWQFEDVSADEIDDVLEGPWSFCFWRPCPPRPSSRVGRVAAAVAVGTLAVLGTAALVANPDPFAPPGGDRQGVHDDGPPRR